MIGQPLRQRSRTPWELLRKSPSRRMGTGRPGASYLENRVHRIGGESPARWADGGGNDRTCGRLHQWNRRRSSSAGPEGNADDRGLCSPSVLRRRPNRGATPERSRNPKLSNAFSSSAPSKEPNRPAQRVSIAIQERQLRSGGVAGLERRTDSHKVELARLVRDHLLKTSVIEEVVSQELSVRQMFDG